MVKMHETPDQSNDFPGIKLPKENNVKSRPRAISCVGFFVVVVVLGFCFFCFLYFFGMQESPKKYKSFTWDIRKSITRYPLEDMKLKDETAG